MAGDEMRTQARALGDPTRYRLYRWIAEQPDAVGIAEMTALVGLHHNAVRQHVATLVDAGLLLEQTEERTTRGRPRLLYRAEPTAAQQWLTPGPYHRLSLLLLDLMESGDTAEAVGHRAGSRNRVRGDRSPIDAMLEAVANEGFEPRLRSVAGHEEVVLDRCPFADAASANPTVVCELHLGLARGIADQIPGIEVLDLVPADPQRAGCRLKVRVDDGSDDPAASDVSAT